MLLKASAPTSRMREAAAEEGLKLSEEAGIGGVILAPFKNLLGEAAWLRGDYERAAELLEESLELHREARNSRGVAWSVCSLGAVSSDREDYERAKELYEEGIAVSRETGGARMLADLLGNLGYIYVLEGDHERATALNDEAAELCRKRGTGAASSMPSTTWDGRRWSGRITSGLRPYTKRTSCCAKK
jgi:tetratricopeptide (TPR) repeat protein